MNIEECKNHYLGLKNIKNFIEKIEPEFFFEFAETVITAYEKEKEKNKELEKQLQSTYQKQHINDLEAINHSSVSFN